MSRRHHEIKVPGGIRFTQATAANGLITRRWIRDRNTTYIIQNKIVRLSRPYSECWHRATFMNKGVSDVWRLLLESIFSPGIIYVAEKSWFIFSKLCYYDCMTVHVKMALRKLCTNLIHSGCNFRSVFKKHSLRLKISWIFSYNKLPSHECHKTPLMTIKPGPRRGSSASLAPDDFCAIWSFSLLAKEVLIQEKCSIVMIRH